MEHQPSIILEQTAMETPQELIEATTARVESILTEHFPDLINFGNGSFAISSGSSQIIVVVRPYTDSDTAVECIANVVSGGDITPELMKFLLRKNAELHFGAFGLLFDDTVIFAHTIAGANIDANELLTSVKSVAVIADHYDDEIVSMAGGRRALDPADFE